MKLPVFINGWPAWFKKPRRGFTLVEILLVMGIFSTTLLLVVNIFVGSTRLQQRTIVTQRRTSDARFTLEIMARSIRSGTVDYDFYYGRTPYQSTLDTVLITDPKAPLHILATIDQDGNRTIFRRKSLDPSGDPWGLNPAGPELADQVEMCLESNICVDGVDYDGSSKTLCNTDTGCPGTETCQLSCEFEKSWSDITPSGVRLTGGSQHPSEPQGLKFVISPTNDPFELQDNVTGKYFSDKQPNVTIFFLTKAIGSELDERKTTLLQTSVSARQYIR
jgi:prepilin-type N-terminal cleavage/methylation domain-containing protein